MQHHHPPNSVHNPPVRTHHTNATPLPPVHPSQSQVNPVASLAHPHHETTSHDQPHLTKTPIFPPSLPSYRVRRTQPKIPKETNLPKHHTRILPGKPQYLCAPGYSSAESVVAYASLSMNDVDARFWGCIS